MQHLINPYFSFTFIHTSITTMQVKLSVSTSIHTQNEFSFKSLANNKIEIKNSIEMFDEVINITIRCPFGYVEALFPHFRLSHLRELTEDTVSILHEVVEHIVTVYDTTGVWFDVNHEMKDSEGYIVSLANFDWLAYYRGLQAEKVSINQTPKQLLTSNVHESFLPILGAMFNPQC